MKRRSLALLILLAAAPALQAQSSGELYQQALRKERTEGDLAAAIKLYQRVSTGPDRELAARALLRLGEAYERLGKQEATQAYERIVRDFGDQHDVAQAARVRLAALKLPVSQKASGALAVHQVLDDVIDAEGPPTPDGRSVIFTDWNKGGNLAIRDLASGSVRYLTTNGNAECSYALSSMVSPDNKQIAYVWVDSTRLCWHTQLRVIGTDGSKPRVLIANTDTLADGYARIDDINVREFTPDHSGVLVTTYDFEGNVQFEIVSLKDGSAKVIRTLPRVGEAAGPARLSPDGKWIAYAINADSMTYYATYAKSIVGASQIVIVSVDGTREVRISQSGVQQRPIWSPDGKYILFASNRGGGEGLWAQRFADGQLVGEPFLIKGEMPWLFHPMAFVNNTLYYSFNRSGSNVMTAPFDATSNRITGEPAIAIPEYQGHNRAASWSADGSRVAYLSQRGITGKNRTLILREMSTGEERVYVKPDITNYGLPRISPNGKYIAVPALRWGVSNTVLVDIATGQMKVFTPAKGFPNPLFVMAWAPDSRTIYSIADLQQPGDTTGTTFPGLASYDVETGTLTVLRDSTRGPSLAISADGRTLAIGRATEDSVRIRLYDIASRQFTAYRSLPWRSQHIGGAFGMAGITFTPDGRHLLLSRIDGPEPDPTCEVFSLDLATGALQSTGLRATAIHDLAFTPDGKLSFAAGPTQKLEIWALENWQSQLPK